MTKSERLQSVIYLYVQRNLFSNSLFFWPGKTKKELLSAGDRMFSHYCMVQEVEVGPSSQVYQDVLADSMQVEEAGESSASE